MTGETTWIYAGRDLNALLAGYAAGHLSPPLHALVAGHLAMERASRRFVACLEAAGGAELDTLAPTPVADRDGKLAAIFGLDSIAVSPLDVPAPGCAVLPEPLRRYLGRDLAAFDWRVVMPGVRQFRAERIGGGEATFYWLQAGRGMPQHRHGGAEITLVLDGAFADGGSLYGPGDVALADEKVEHAPVADGRQGCLCFTVNEGPVRLTGPVGLLQQLHGR